LVEAKGCHEQRIFRDGVLAYILEKCIPGLRREMAEQVSQNDNRTGNA
jgi:hypothetical protein